MRRGSRDTKMSRLLILVVSLCLFVPEITTATNFNTTAFWKRKGTSGGNASWTAIPGLDSEISATLNLRFAAWTGTDFISLAIDLNGNPTVSFRNALSGQWTHNTHPSNPASFKDFGARWVSGKAIFWGGDSSIYSPLYVTSFDTTTGVWSPVSTAPAGFSATSVADFTGTQLLVLGDSSFPATASNAGYIYNLAANTWTPMTTTSAPSARKSHNMIWTGTQLTLWGGLSSANSPLNTGAYYNPGSNTWTGATSTGANVPAARFYHSATMGGSKMFIWGGAQAGATYINSGAILDTTNNTWSSMSTVSAPSGRWLPATVWTGNKFMVFGGFDGVTSLNDGAIYDPSTDSWTALSPSPISFGMYCTMAWSGTRVLVLCPSNIGFYDPASNTWDSPPNDSAGLYPSLAWTGSQVLRWGGMSDIFGPANGTSTFLYNSATQTWTPRASSSGIVSGRRDHSFVWTGTQALIWGGTSDGQTSPGTTPAGPGGVYTLATDTWSTMSSTGQPGPRVRNSTVWDGTRMTIWGGTDLGSGFIVNSGHSYNPATNTWTNLAWTSNPPPNGREQHSALLISNKMWIWGGSDGSTYPTQLEVYDFTAQDWSVLIPANAPVGRVAHSAVAAGTKIIVWGGMNEANELLDTGKIYDTTTGVWSDISSVGAPSARSGHVAYWTGSRMILWGGVNENTPLNDGAIYNPATNSWQPMPTVDAPPGRFAFGSTWTGSKMVIWGGYGYGGASSVIFGSGAFFNP